LVKPIIYEKCQAIYINNAFCHIGLVGILLFSAELYIPGLGIGKPFDRFFFMECRQGERYQQGMVEFFNSADDVFLWSNRLFYHVAPIFSFAWLVSCGVDINFLLSEILLLFSTKAFLL